MTGDKTNHRSVVTATLAASFMMLVCGLTYRTLAGRLSAPVSKVPLAPAALQGFPMQVSDWAGADVAVEEAEAILGKISAEASINRRYSRGNGSASIFLFIAASGITDGTLVGHPPEICNVCNGYTLTGQRCAEVPLSNERKLPCRILQFSRDTQSGREKKTVLYYYMADDQYCGNRSLLRSRVRRGATMVHCIAQVQIVASATESTTTAATTKIVCDFATDSAPTIARFFENIAQTRDEDFDAGCKRE